MSFQLPSVPHFGTRGAKSIAACLAVGALFAGCSSSTARKESSAQEAGAAAASAPLRFASPGSGEASTLADVAEEVTPSVVNVHAERVIVAPGVALPESLLEDPFFRRFFAPEQLEPRKQRRQSLGSGVIVGENGLIVTNSHLVASAEDIEVTLADGRDYQAAIVGRDPKSDVAVLQLQSEVPGLVPLRWGDSSRLRPGNIVLAIGNPFGVGQTVTMGIVSATGRADLGLVDYEDFIQTDAAINPGNSGGALVNMSGELIGINTAILSRTGGSQGIGFAIPSNLARLIEEDLVEYGRVVRGWLGVTIQDLNDELAAALGVSPDAGVLISDIAEDAPARRAGLQRGDLVVAINGRKVASASQLRNRVAQLAPGTAANFDIRRQGEALTLKITLGEQPAETETPSPSVEESKEREEEGVFEGATLSELAPELRRRLELPDSLDDGIVVVSVQAHSRAHEIGLRSGDVLLEVNREAIGSLAELRETESSAEDPLLLLIWRQGATLFLAG